MVRCGNWGAVCDAVRQGHVMHTIQENGLESGKSRR